ncbi:MAG: S8 family serine peptidase, partial [Pseudomonadota bacterium]
LNVLKGILVLSALLVGACATDRQPLTEEPDYSKRVIFTVPALASQDDDTGRTAGTLDGTRSDGGLANLLRLHGLIKIAQWPIRALGLDAIVAEITDASELSDVLNALADDDRVESVEEVSSFDLMTTYNDPYFPMQQTSVPQEMIGLVHSRSTGSGVTVALIDTGVDRQHPELANSVVLAQNHVMDEGSDVFDQDEHGTTVAGIISAAADNHLGIVGIAPDAQLMVFKACRHVGATSRARCDSQSLVRALIAVSEAQPDILNLSLVGSHSLLIERLLNSIVARGTLVTAAVDANRSTSFPAEMGSVVAVASPVGRDQLPAGGMVAPATDILTTTPGATYAFRSGSSLATAYVSGVAALMKSAQPGISHAALRSQLRSSVTSDSKDDSTVPMINMCQAVIRDDAMCLGSNAIASIGR